MYTLAPATQQLFINPTTQALASDGFVWFYKDSDRTTIKPVYHNTGTPGNPIYTQAPLNPDGSLSLNASGAFPFFIYYYPFDVAGDYDLYYVVAKTSDGIQILAEGNYPTLNDIEVVSQLTYFISTACTATPNLADKTQLAESVSQYVHVVNYYEDSSGTANIYVAAHVSGELPCSLSIGMRIRFTPSITNTGASTLTFTTKSGTTTHPILNPVTGTALSANELKGAQSYFQPTAELEYVPGQGWFLMSTPEGSSPTYLYQVKAVAADPTPDFLVEKVIEGAGISVVLSGDNTHLTVNQRIIDIKTQGVLTTTTVLNGSVTSGAIILTSAFIPAATVNSQITVTAYFCGGLYGVNTGGSPFDAPIVYLEEAGVCLAALTLPTQYSGGAPITNDNGLILSATIPNLALTSRTFNLRWGVTIGSVTGAFSSTFYPGLTWIPDPHIILSITESLNI